ncbi:DNA-directed RNA polymerase I subunit RPA49-like isoform X2 [Littorina saxatilis]|uniref:DNA-directed RNA polymerase I subunit RPA49-like isoform X2 n=1 Tax=Littorina saxatilis TaxID=31220 RepID=UPI0038B4B383
MERLSVAISDKEVPLVAFANGVIKKESRKRKLALSAFKHSKHKGGGKRKKVMIAESDKLTYRGDNFGPLAVQTQPTQLYVAEVDKLTGKMTMFPAEIFNMHPVTEVDTPGEAPDLESMSYREKSDLLTDAFGSGKQKRALQKRQKNKMVEGAVTSAMGSAVDSAKATQQSQPAPTAQHTSSAIPPCNTDAKAPADVYKLNDIIGAGELESLKNAAQELCQCGTEKMKEWRDNKTYHMSVLSRLQVLPMDEERRLRQACLLLYLHYLLALFQYRSEHYRKKDPLPAAWPDMVKRMMLDRFSVKLDGSKRLQMHSRALGCKVKSESRKEAGGVKVTSYIAMLKIPLTFPEPAKAKKKQQ